jgi:hypothetical protein
MTGVYRELSGLPVSPVPDQDTSLAQPILSQEINALLYTAGASAKWTGFQWSITRKGKTYAASRKLGCFDDWRATVAAVVEATT